MSVLAKVLIAVSAVFSLVFLGMSATVYHWATDYKAANDKLVTVTDTWKKETSEVISGLKGQIADLDKVRDARENEVRVWKDQFEDEKTKLNQANEDKQKLDQRLDDQMQTNKSYKDLIEGSNRQIENQRLQLDQKKDELTIANRDKKTAEDQVARLTGIKAALEQDLSQLRKQHETASRKVKDLELVLATLEEEGVPVGLIVSGSPPAKPVSGVVVAVRNDLKPALVLLSVGKDDGVEIGYQFTVYRGADFVGRVVVEKVMADVSGARVLFTADGRQVTEGDNAATRLQ